MTTLSDVCGSRYLLYRNLVECGFGAARASLAVDVLLGREDDACEPEAEVPYEPTDEDLDDYARWADRIDREFRVGPDDHDYVSDRDVLVATGCVG